MSGVEFAGPPDPELYLSDVLNRRSPIPAGKADISELRAAAALAEGTEPGYAWERVPLWLAEVKEPYGRIGGAPIITLDLCSSVPTYAQILRSLEFDRDGVRGRELVRGLFNEESVQRLGEEAPKLKPIVHAIGRDSATRDLLEAAVQESLYEITAEEAAGSYETNPLYRERLRAKLRQQAVTYSEDRDSVPREVGRDFRVARVAHEQTYLDRLAALAIPWTGAGEARQWLRYGSRNPLVRQAALHTEPVGFELAEQFIDWQAARLAEKVVGHLRYRPARFLSMDVVPPGEIAISSILNTPAPTQALDVFSHAVNSLFEPTSHFTGNLFDELPVPDNSLALITCFDAWPFYFQTDDRAEIRPEEQKEAVMATLQTFYDKLAYGGKMIFFPWAALSEAGEHHAGVSNEVLKEAAAEFAGQNGVPFDLRGIHRDTLHDWMSPSDRTTAAELSPIFDSQETYLTALIVSKPKESSAKASNSWLARMAAHDQLNGAPASR